MIKSTQHNEQLKFSGVCKTAACSPDGELSFQGLELIHEQSDDLVRVNYSISCTCSNGGILKSSIFARPVVLYGMASKLIKASLTPIELVKNFAMMMIKFNAVGIKGQLEFHRYNSDSNTTFKQVPSWLDLIKIEKVSYSSISESELVVREKGIGVINEYLTAGYFKTMMNADHVKVSEILNRVKLRDRNAVIEVLSAAKIDVKNVSMELLIYTLNATYFTHFNPLHEIQWVVAGILLNHDPFDDKDTNSLLRIAIHFLWQYREGEVSNEFGIIQVHTETEIKKSNYCIPIHGMDY